MFNFTVIDLVNRKWVSIDAIDKIDALNQVHLEQYGYIKTRDAIIREFPKAIAIGNDKPVLAIFESYPVIKVE